MFKFQRILLAGWCILLFAQSGAAQTLHWKFSEGDVFGINIVQSSTVTTLVDRRDVDQGNTMTMDIEWLVEGVDDKNLATVRQTITRVQVELTVPGKEGSSTVSYDSDAERHRGQSRRMDSSFSKIVGQPVTLTVTAAGNIVDVDVPEETMDRLRNMPGSMQGRKMFELESIKELFVQSGMSLPDGELADGESWEVKRDFSIGTPRTFEQTTSYTVDSLADEPVEIRFSSTLAPKETPESDAAGDTIEFEQIEIAEQNSGGTILFDREAGNCLSSNSETTMKTTSTYRDMEVSVTIKSEVEMTVDRK